MVHSCAGQPPPSVCAQGLPDASQWCSATGSTATERAQITQVNAAVRAGRDSLMRPATRLHCQADLQQQTERSASMTDVFHNPCSAASPGGPSACADTQPSGLAVTA